MADETEVIRHQMEEKRTELTEKLEALEDKILGTVQDARDTVAETVTSVKEAVKGTVETVTGTVQDTVETVKEAFDLPAQMEKRPWLMFGGAVAVGYLGGYLLGRSSSPRSLSRDEGNGQTRTTPPPPYTPQPATPPPSMARDQESWLDKLTDQLAPALNKLRGLAIGATTGLLGEMVLSAVPNAMRQQVNELVNEFTTSLGGTPVRGLIEKEENQNKEEAGYP